jgi:tetratricopeptide (TPR) repeat protein
MKKILFCILYLSSTLFLQAQTLEEKRQEAKNLHLAAKTYLQKADYSNATMVFNQAILLDPTNIAYKRDLAMAYFMQRNYVLAIEVIAPLLKEEDADEDVYQLAGKIYSDAGLRSEARNALDKGIKKFPTAGFLYNQKGEIYGNIKKYSDAMKEWEKGIKMAPQYHMNYFNAASSYYFSKKYIWAIIYGEMFVNLESNSKRSDDMKAILLESYKQLISEINYKKTDTKNDLNNEEVKTFEEAYTKTLLKLINTVVGGINAESITLLRTRFLLDWNKRYARNFPLELIDYNQRMLQNGYFDAYNQWLFGRVDNEETYKIWTQKNATLMNDFDKYFKSVRLSPKTLQYYH